MKVAIRYFSKGGNTKKLAYSVSKILNTEPKEIFIPLEEDVDILFLGTAVYAFGIDEKVKEFISNINVNVGQIVCFNTSASNMAIRKFVDKEAAKKSIRVSEKDFHCKGSYGPFNKGKPDEADIEDFQKFVKEVISSI
jgi:flavodoxin